MKRTPRNCFLGVLFIPGLSSRPANGSGLSKTILKHNVIFNEQNAVVNMNGTC